MSPDRRYLLDTYSTPLIPQVTVVRDLNGNVLTTVEEAGFSTGLDRTRCADRF